MIPRVGEHTVRHHVCHHFHNRSRMLQPTMLNGLLYCSDSMSRWACPSTTETPLTSTLDSGNCMARTGARRSTGSFSSTRYKQFQLATAATQLGGLTDTSTPSPPMYWSSHDRRIPRLGDRTKPLSWENRALSEIQRRNSWSSAFDTARLSSTSSIFMASSHRPKLSAENTTWHSSWRRRSVLVATATWQVQQDNSGAKYHGKCSSGICWPNSRLGTLAPHNEHPTEGVTREVLATSADSNGCCVPTPAPLHSSVRTCETSTKGNLSCPACSPTPLDSLERLRAPLPDPPEQLLDTVPSSSLYGLRPLSSWEHSGWNLEYRLFPFSSSDIFGKKQCIRYSWVSALNMYMIKFIFFRRKLIAVRKVKIHSISLSSSCVPPFSPPLRENKMVL